MTEEQYREYQLPLVRAGELRSKIELGEIADPKVLDHYLTYSIEAERELAAQATDLSKEQYGESILQLMKAKNGGYHKEKARFCLAQANDEREKANNMDREENRTVPNIVETDRQEAINIFKRHAANWLSMAACLEMPIESRAEI